MPNFMMVYKGAAPDMDSYTPEQIGEIMGAWQAWMGGLGEAMVDGGSPFGPSSSVVDDGSAGSAAPLTGYTVVAADDIAGAQAMANGHPFLSEGKGDYAIDIFEMLPAPGM